MGSVVWIAAYFLEAQLVTPGLRYPALAAIVALGTVTYAGLTLILGAIRPAQLKSALKRK